MSLLVRRKEATRRRILTTATRLFLENGVDRVGIDEIMRASGLTHGGFYCHFDTKEALFAAAYTATLQEAPERWRDLVGKLDDEAAWADFSRRCIAGELGQTENPARALALFGADAARRPDARPPGDAALVRLLIEEVAEARRSDRAEAILIIAALVGANSLAAQMSLDKATAAEILNIVRNRLLAARPGGVQGRTAKGIIARPRPSTRRWLRPIPRDRPVTTATFPEAT